MPGGGEKEKRGSEGAPACSLGTFVPCAMSGRLPKSTAPVDRTFALPVLEFSALSGFRARRRQGSANEHHNSLKFNLLQRSND